MEIFCSFVIILFSTYYKLYFTATKNAFQNKQQFLGFRTYKEICIGKKILKLDLCHLSGSATDV